MGKVIKFREKGTEVPFSEEDFERLDLERLLARSNRLSKKRFNELEDLKILIMKSGKDASAFFEGLLSKEIVRRKNISSVQFLCGNYISHLLTSFLDSYPELWVAFDYEYKYHETGNPNYLRKGGDFCFLLCSIFEGRNFWRLTSPEFYSEKGKSLYYQSYLKEQKEISFHMSSNFEEMVKITKYAVSRS